MLDKLLELGAVFDWISPLVAEVQDHVNGPAHTFLIPDDCGWSAREIERLLRTPGVKTWGLMIVDHMILITVSLAQARWAQYILLREGIPIQYGVQRERKPRTSGAPQRKNPSLLSEILDRWLGL